MSFRSLLLNADRNQVRRIVQLLENLSNPSVRETELQELTTLYPYLNTMPHRAHLGRLTNGWFDLQNLILILQRQLSLQPTTNQTISSSVLITLLEQLEYHGLVTKNWYGNNGPEYLIQQGMFQAHRRARIVDYVVFGINYLLEDIRNSVPAINIRRPDQDINCGTGSLISVVDGFMLLTNRHIVENNEIVSIQAGSLTYDVLNDPILCETDDLALVPVNRPNGTSVLSMTPDLPILSSVISIGYPRIPTAAAQYALAHRGEINGAITDRNGREFITISNLVSPGNSGGPILNEKGEIVGVVTQSAFGESRTASAAAGTYSSTYHLAIPPSVIIQFIREASNSIQT